MNIVEPADGFLEKVRDLAHKYKSVFIFDETITGFRYANGGAQEYFGVIPDLATFGKGMANGYPVSALAGKAEIMRMVEDIFFSFTFAGETLSLAAALATMNKLQREPVTETLRMSGKKVFNGVTSLIEKHGLEEVIKVGGKECWSFLLFNDAENYSQWELKSLFLQEIFSRGILSIGTHNMSYAHNDSDIKQLMKVYDRGFGIMVEAIKEKSLDRLLNAEPLVPLFSVR
jgi:glutamate-1-semialdehyde 2,1-aminomutase